MLAFVLKSTSQLFSQEISRGEILYSTIFIKGVYPIHTDASDTIPYLSIQRDNLEIDFNSSILDARNKSQLPDSFSGIALYIHDCKNVIIRNLDVHGFKMAILAERVTNLTIENCDLSYNYRPKLYSHWDRESLTDWLYFHHNENDEWKRYGAAIYLKNCPKAIIHEVTCHQGMNGLLMVQCDNGLIYNNDIQFNSGLGIGLYRSGFNRIMHNKLDWNARGYSHGQYARGQDSAALLLYEQSSGNTIAYNSATHSGDGFFLWAGQHTMDTGLGGCDDNIIYQNDFSHSIANGIEATFSSNIMANNILNDCHYGVWAGYSHHSFLQGNEIKNCETGIAIEHGRYISLAGNEMANDKTGIKLWSRQQQPEDWPYVKVNNVAGRAYSIHQNHFINVGTALDLLRTDSVELEENTFVNVSQVYSKTVDTTSIIHQPGVFTWSTLKTTLPKTMMAGQETKLPADQLQGRKYIIVNEWGPYDFQYPTLALRQKLDVGEELWYSFDVYGPKGKWRVDSVEGCTLSGPTSGTFPDSLKLFCPYDKPNRFIGLSFIGDSFITQFGDSIPGNTRYPFYYTEFNPQAIWNISFFSFDSLSDPITQPSKFSELLKGPPVKAMMSSHLTFHWWDKPYPEVPAEQFAVKARTSFFAQEGNYIIQTESDDGIRVWMDNQLIVDHWDIHTPAIDEVKLKLNKGQHEIKLEYFDAGGLAVLDVSILKT